MLADQHGGSAMPAREALPGTLKRSPKKARETWLETHDSAVEQYGEGEQAHRTAFKQLKRGWEKVDDRWERKNEPGPSDPRSRNRGRAARQGRGEALRARLQADPQPKPAGTGSTASE